jgi:hypothetical protein
MSSGYVLVIPLAVSFVSALCAYLLDRRLAQRGSCKSFLWGYYFALIHIFTGTCLLTVGVLFLQVAAPSTPAASNMLVLVSLCYVILGFSSLSRSRFSLVALTLVTANPVVWGVNYVYLRGRWAELART